MSIHEEIAQQKYKLLWDSLRLGCKKILEALPNDPGAKCTLAHMDLIEALVNVGETAIKEIETNKESTDE